MRLLHVRTATRRHAGGGPPGSDLSTWSRNTGSRTTVRVAGEVDLVTAPMLKEALESAYLGVRTYRAHPELLVDLRGVSFLSAAGLTVLAILHVRCVTDGLSMHIVGDQRAVRRPMELTGLDQLLAKQ
jgi:anti-sigma B factor antagonist